MTGQDFTAALTSGTTTAPWEDPARPAGTTGVGDPGAPSRLNPIVGYPHLRRMAHVGTPVVITATVGGVVGPMDAALAGRLFTTWWVERPGPGVPPIAGAAGQSSVQTFTPMDIGHYTIGIRREGGGAVLMHIDAEAP